MFSHVCINFRSQSWGVIQYIQMEKKGDDDATASQWKAQTWIIWVGVENKEHSLFCFIQMKEKMPKKNSRLTDFCTISFLKICDESVVQFRVFLKFWSSRWD